METMTKRERIRNVLEGKPVDRTPVGFWLHFPEEMHHGEKAIEAHLDFMKATDTDILKIMNENILYDGNTKIERLGDISKFRGFSRKDAIFQDQMEIIKRIADKAKGSIPSCPPSTALLPPPSMRQVLQATTPVWDTSLPYSAGNVRLR